MVKIMRFILLGLIRIIDALMALAVLTLFSAGVYSIWLEFLNKPYLIVELINLVGFSLLAWLIGRGLNYLIQRKVDLSPPYEYWQPETALYSSQWGSPTINPGLTWLMYLLAIACFLPIFYSLLPDILFWVLLFVLSAIGLFCLAHCRVGLIHREIHTNYLPRTQAFIDFYLASIKGGWSEEMEQLFAKIDSASTDYQVAKQLRALLKREPQQAVIQYDYIDIGYGPGFDATPENILARREASFEDYDARLKTPEHLG